MQRAWPGRLPLFALLGMSLALACAPLPGDEVDGEADVTSVNITTAVPSPAQGTPNSPTTPNGSTTTGTGSGTGGSAVAFVPPAGTLGQTPGFDGASFRWHRNPNLCITRKTATPTDLDPLTLAPCAADIKQAFSMTNGYVSTSKTFPWARKTETKEVVVRYTDNVSVDGTQPLYLSMSGDGTTNYLSSTSGFLVPKDPAGSVGTPILMDPASAGGSGAVWDVVGVGNVGGTLMPITNNGTTSCLLYGSNGLTLSACDRTVTEQRWRYDGGFLVNDNGKCLTCTSARSCILQSCAAVSRTSPNDQRWKLALYMTYATSFGGNYYVYQYDKSSSQAFIAPSSDINTSNSSTKGFVLQFGFPLTSP